MRYDPWNGQAKFSTTLRNPRLILCFKTGSFHMPLIASIPIFLECPYYSCSRNKPRAVSTLDIDCNIFWIQQSFSVQTMLKPIHVSWLPTLHWQSYTNPLTITSYIRDLTISVSGMDETNQCTADINLKPFNLYIHIYAWSGKMLLNIEIRRDS